MRLQKYLALCSVASRRAAEKLIAEGRVQVGGVTVTELGTKVSEEDEVLVDGKAVKAEQKKVYIMLNKPVGYLTTVHDERGRRTVMELTGDIKERIYPVGRLDFNTEGLLLMTNDGDFAYKITHPGHETKKTYEAAVSGIVSLETAKRLERGVVIDGRKTAPAKVEIVSHKKNSTVLKITIHEGRNRQVRKMCASVGHSVISLKRISVGTLMLGNLPLGKWRHLSKDEITAILKNKGANGANADN